MPGGAGPTVLLVSLALLAAPAAGFRLAEPGGEEAHHHHLEHQDHQEHQHHKEEHEHQEHQGELHVHGHHAHDEKEHHEDAREGKAEALSNIISDVYDKSVVAASLAAAEARGGVDFSQATVVTASDGSLKSCVEKEEIREELRREPVVECLHKSVEKCHFTYTTQFLPHVEEVCEDIFTKHCTITINQVAVNETVQHCYRPLVEDCAEPDLSGEECREYFESACTTRYLEKSPGKFVGDTACERLPRTHCAPAGCAMVPGEEVCHDKTVGSLTARPEEHCDLTPRRHCRHKTTLVPRLKPVPECTVVPKEVCTVRQVQRLVSVPVRSLWCQKVEPPPEEPEVEVGVKTEAVEAPLPGYEEEDEEAVYEYEDYQSSGDDLPGYQEEEATTEGLAGYGYEYPEPEQPLQPPRPTTTLATTTTLAPTTTTLAPTTTTTLATTTAAPEPVTALTLPAAPGPALAPPAPPTRTVQLRPEDLQAVITASLREAVRAAVAEARELQAAAREEELRGAVQAAVAEAVRRALVSSVESQTASRQAQSSLGLQRTVQQAVRGAVQAAVEGMLAQHEHVMTAGMAAELAVMEERVEAAVAGAVRAAVESAVAGAAASGGPGAELRAAVEAAVRRSVQLVLVQQRAGDSEAVGGAAAVASMVRQAVAAAVRARLAQRVEGESLAGVRAAVLGGVMASVERAARGVQGDRRGLLALLEQEVRRAVEESMGPAGGRDRVPRMQAPRKNGPTSMFDQ